MLNSDTKTQYKGNDILKKAKQNWEKRRKENETSFCSRVVPVYVKDEGNGTYTLSFTPNISGNMLLTVLIQNKHIKV